MVGVQILLFKFSSGAKQLDANCHQNLFQDFSQATLDLYSGCTDLNYKDAHMSYRHKDITDYVLNNCWSWIIWIEDV